MKKILLIIFVLFCIKSFSQSVNNNPFVINVALFGAKGDMLSDSASITSGTATLTRKNAGFLSGDVGKTIRITGAGAAGVDLITTISAYTSSTVVTIAVNASTTITNKPIDYGTENTAFLQAAANAVPTTGAIYKVPLGKYLITGTVVFNNPTRILGDMSSRGTYIFDSVTANKKLPSSGIYEMSSNLYAAIVIQSSGSNWEGLDLECNSGNTITSGIGLDINAGNVSMYQSIFVGFWNSVAQNYSLEWRMDHCIVGSVNYGVFIQNLASQDSGDWTIYDCIFAGSSTTKMMAAIEVKSSGGGKITNCKFNTVFHKGIEINFPNSSSSTSDFIFLGNSFENFDSAAIKVVTLSNAAISNIQIIGNQITSATVGTNGIILDGSASTGLFTSAVISGNIFSGTGGANDSAIVLRKVISAYVPNDNVFSNSWTTTVYYTTPAASRTNEGDDFISNSSSAKSAGYSVYNDIGTGSFTMYGSANAVGLGYTGSLAIGASANNIIMGTDGSTSLGGSHNITFRLGGYNTSNDRVRFFSTGTVGIGLFTDSTTSKLVVGGNIKANGNLNLNTAGNKIQITTGTNASVGQATLTGGTVTVSTTAVTASSLIFLTDATTGALTNVGSPTVGTITAGTSFVINSTNVLDTSNVNWFIIN